MNSNEYARDSVICTATPTLMWTVYSVSFLHLYRRTGLPYLQEVICECVYWGLVFYCYGIDVSGSTIERKFLSKLSNNHLLKTICSLFTQSLKGSFHFCRTSYFLSYVQWPSTCHTFYSTCFWQCWRPQGLCGVSLRLQFTMHPVSHIAEDLVFLNKY
jgi:hypothetical protein